MVTFLIRRKCLQLKIKSLKIMACTRSHILGKLMSIVDASRENKNGEAASFFLKYLTSQLAQSEIHEKTVMF